MAAPVDLRLQALQYADSYSRMGALLALRRRRDFWQHVGREWSGCDNLASYYNKLVLILVDRQDRQGFPVLDAMDDNAKVAFDALPDVVTVWRGCYSHNVRGISWTLDRRIAARFPFLRRYRHNDAIDRALLIEGRIAKANIAFLVTDRGEREVVTLPYSVEIVGQSLAYDALDGEARNQLFPRGREAA